jgi:NAD(P)-dependent dehydrogenase (short-subunit alcohol dehydrogenase family)
MAGSSSGIGREAAAQLAEAGVRRIVINGRNPRTGAEAVAEVKRRVPAADVRFIAADTSKPEAARRLVDETVKAFGRVDILVNAASGGWLTPRPFHEVPIDRVPEVFDCHLMTALYCCHAAYPKMQEQGGGVIVNFSADAAKIATPGEAIHGAVQAAVLMLSRTLAIEGARFGVRVNCITPSITKDTNSYDRMMADPFSQKLFVKAEKRARLGVAAAKDIAPLVVFLSGPGATHLTGQAISVNGGISAA